jgi:hypothetical protein
MKWLSIVSVRAVLATGAVVTLALAALVVWRSSQAIRSPSEDVRADHEFRFVAQPLPQPINAGFELVRSPAVFLQARPLCGGWSIPILRHKSASPLMAPYF